MIIAFALLILIIGISLVSYFIFFKEKDDQNKYRSEIESDQVQEQPSELEKLRNKVINSKSAEYEDNLVTFLEKDFEHSRDVADNKKEDLYNVNDELNTYHTTTKNQCNQLKNQEKREQCLQTLRYYDIVNKNNIDRCEELSGKIRDLCYFRLGRQAKDWKICYKIKTKSLEEACVHDNGFINNNTDVCEYFEEEGSEEEVDHHEHKECVDRIKAINNGDIVKQQQKGDISNCSEITTLEYFNQCVLRSDNKCTELENEDLVKKCQSIRYFSSIINTDNKENCELLPLERFSKVCNIYFQEGKKFIDSDDDGLPDNKELWFNTDPFEAFGSEEEHVLNEGSDLSYSDILYTNSDIDSDNDGISDFEELKSGTDPSIPNN